MWRKVPRHCHLFTWPINLKQAFERRPPNLPIFIFQNTFNIMGRNSGCKYFGKLLCSSLSLYHMLPHIKPTYSSRGTVSKLILYLVVTCMGTAQRLQCQTHGWIVVGSSPNRSGGRIFFSMVNFLSWLISVSLPPLQHMNDPSHSAKSADGWLQLNTHAPQVCGFE